MSWLGLFPVRTSILAWASLVLLVVGGRGAVAAQAPADGSRPERPNRALFGGGVGDAEQSLILGASTGGGLERLTLGTPAGAESAPDFPSGRLLSGEWAANVAYTTTRRRGGLRASGGVSGRHVNGISESLVSRNGSFGAHLDLTRRTRVQATASLADTPVSFSGLFPGMSGSLGGGGGTGLPIDYMLGGDLASQLTQHAQLQLSQEFSTGSSVTAGYNYRRVVVASSDFDRASQFASVGFSQPLTRHLSLRLGYGRGLSRADAGSTVDDYGNHSFDVGLDFNRPLSLSRRTSLDIRTGSTVLSDGVYSRFALTGAATVTHEIGRTWRLALAYTRQADFQETLRAPAFGDTATLSWGGQINRRVQFFSSLGVALGSIGLGPESSDYRAHSARTGVVIGLTRFVGLTVDYAYDDYGFDDVSVVPVAFAGDIQRHSLRANVNLWAPVFYRRGRSNAAR